MDEIIGQIEQTHSLDAPAATVQSWVRKVIPPGPVDDLLRGKPLGHPLHPALVTLPIGAWTSAIAADLVGEPGAARKLTALGCVSALPAAAAGAVDWVGTEGAARRVGLVHALVNDTALICFTMSWRARRGGSRGRGFLLSLAGAGVLTAGAWLGGHLAYSQGVGVDVTSFLAREADPDR
jgi:uncharacterized membrane protein